MTVTKRLASSALLLAGVALVFAGLSAALGFSAGGMIAASAVIAALLYAGAVWSRKDAPAAGPVHPINQALVFDGTLRLVSAAGSSGSLLTRFPESLRPEIEMRCLAALSGRSTRFTCEHGSERVVFDAVPVRDNDGTIVYGMLLCGVSGAPRVAAASPAGAVRTG